MYLQNSFAAQREVNFQQNQYNISHHTFSVLPHCLAKVIRRKLEVWICGNFPKKYNNRVTFDKTKTSLVMWLNIVTIVARSVRFFCTHACVPLINIAYHSSIALSMMVCSVPCQTCRKRCFIHNTGLDKIVCYLNKIFNRNRKLKQHVSM